MRATPTLVFGLSLFVCRMLRHRVSRRTRPNLAESNGLRLDIDPRIRLKSLVRVIPLLVLAWSGVACSSDLEDDHVVINGLPALGASDSWFVLLDRPADPVSCNVLTGCNAGSVVRATNYGIIGDVDQAKLAALDKITEVWMPIGEFDPLLDAPILFRFPGDIDTSSNAAFLRLGLTTTLICGGASMQGPGDRQLLIP